MCNRVLEININDFKENILKVKELVGDNVDIMPIIKANAYGTYINKKLELINQFEIVGVATVEEGKEIRKLGFQNEIFILNQPTTEEIEDIILNDLIIGVSSEEFIKCISNLKNNFKVHIEIETGMGRTGILPNNIKQFIKNIGKNIKVEGIYTHLSSADSDEDYTKKQINIFKSIVDQIEEELGTIKYKHVSSSNGIVNFNDSYFNLVRPGMILYGYQTQENMYSKLDVKPIAKLKSKINFIKYVDARNQYRIF